LNDDLSRLGLHQVGPMQCDDDLLSREENLVLPRLWELCTRTERTTIPERIRTKVLDISAVSHAFRDELRINKLRVYLLGEWLPPISIRI
jgi:hypothetical protein